MLRIHLFSSPICLVHSVVVVCVDEFGRVLCSVECVWGMWWLCSKLVKIGDVWADSDDSVFGVLLFGMHKSVNRLLVRCEMNLFEYDWVFVWMKQYCCYLWRICCSTALILSVNLEKKGLAFLSVLDELMREKGFWSFIWVCRFGMMFTWEFVQPPLPMIGNTTYSKKTRLWKMNGLKTKLPLKKLGDKGKN
jgi:hypothetical protein